MGKTSVNGPFCWTSWCFSWSWSMLKFLKILTCFVPKTTVFPSHGHRWKTHPRGDPRRSAWARSMLLLFRISSGSGTSAAPKSEAKQKGGVRRTANCPARIIRIGWCMLMSFQDWLPFLGGYIILFQCQKKNTNSWGWFTDSYPLVQERLAQFGSSRVVFSLINP